MAFVNGVVPSNRNIMELVEIVKPLVREIVEHVNKVNLFMKNLIILWTDIFSR